MKKRYILIALLGALTEGVAYSQAIESGDSVYTEQDRDTQRLIKKRAEEAVKLYIRSVSNIVNSKKATPATREEFMLSALDLFRGKGEADSSRVFDQDGRFIYEQSVSPVSIQIPSPTFRSKESFLQKEYLVDLVKKANDEQPIFFPSRTSNYRVSTPQRINEGKYQVDVTYTQTFRGNEQTSSTVTCYVGTVYHRQKRDYWVELGDIALHLPAYTSTQTEVTTPPPPPSSLWEDIAYGEYNSTEVSFGYSKRFALNASISTNYSYLNLGVDFGYQFNEKSSFIETDSEYGQLRVSPKCYAMFTPGVYLRYATISCGVGGTVLHSVSAATNTGKYADIIQPYFAVKPKLTLNIPIPFDFEWGEDGFYISPYVGYHIIPSHSEFNELEFGLGIRFQLNLFDLF